MTYPASGIVSYAQNREDVLLWRALHDVDAGFYIDVGAHDPRNLSVTLAFYERGWSGINIEPDRFYAEKLRRERERDQTMEFALGRVPGKAVLFDFGDRGLSTVEEGIASSLLASGMEVSQHEVEVRTLSSVLDEIADKDVHFLKIDVEGAEHDVLADRHFDVVRPWIILVEAVRPVTLEPTHEAWEPGLLAQGYEFAWFDGLNRFYVAQERRDRLEAFRVPVNINDGFRDATILSLEQKLEQLRIRHGFSPAPALALISEVPISSQVDDAAGLLRVVQAQATELSRLRRGLVAAQALAEQRLEMIAAVAEAPRAPGTAPVTDLEIPQQVLRQLQADIDDIVRRSRWRRLGRRLRLAKPTDWEQADWAPDPTLLAPGLLATAQDEQRLAAEITRLAQHRGDLGRSRWRRLGQRIGLAKRLPWEDQPASIEPPVMASKLGTSAEAPPVVAQSSGYAALIEYTTGRFFAECRRAAVDVVLDVGANAGQFGAGLRSMGYAGHIISFEPLSEAHAALTARAEADPLWSIAPRCAVGAQEGEATIHVAGNSYSSSLLPMLQRHLSAAPESGYVDQEHCAVVSLDDFIDRTFTDRSTSIGLKIDTQGFEAEVLKGLERNIGRVEVVLCEMSLTPLYDGAPAMLDLCAQLAALGFRCIALGPEFADPRNGVLLQVDGVFVRAPASAASAG